MGISTEAKAFILVISAGLCTAIGAAVVFFPRLASLANPICLAISLGLASGVMLYIALVDIYSKAVDGFTTANGDEDMSFIWATLSFFLGAVIMLVLDKVVYLLLQWEMKRIGVNLNDCNDEQAAVAGIITGSAEDPAQALRNMKKRFEDKLNAKREIEKVIKDDQHHGDVENNAGDEERSVSTERLTDATLTTDPKHAQPLRHMGFAMALAVAIHNLPEGMVTYLAYVEEPAVGVALAVGIAIHNIPEGLCVAMPLYYATGKRLYSFMWGTLSGITEPFGALLTWLVLNGDMGGIANGLLFGIVAGMMTVISVQELLPNAHKYANQNGMVVTLSFLFGAFCIAASLMLFSV